MTDVIKRAQELVQEFDGQITDRWGKDFEGDISGDIVHMGQENPAKHVTETDLMAMSSVPEMLAVIKGLLGMVEILERQIFLSRHTPQKGNHRTDFEWKYTYWEAVNKIHSELNINTATSCDVAIAAICKIDNLTQENQSLKQRVAELENNDD